MALDITNTVGTGYQYTPGIGPASVRDQQQPESQSSFRQTERVPQTEKMHSGDEYQAAYSGAKTFIDAFDKQYAGAAGVYAKVQSYQARDELQDMLGISVYA